MSRQMERQVVANGLRLHLLEWGGGAPPLLLLHGGSAHAHWWDWLAPLLAPKFRLVAPDWRGHGDSAWAEPPAYATTDYVDDLAALMQVLALPPPVLVGHSMGGHNALVFAASHPTALRAVVVIDIEPEYSPAVIQFLSRLADKPGREFNSLDEAVEQFRLLPRETFAPPERLRALARESFRRAQRGTWSSKLDRRTLRRSPVNAWSRLAEIECPVLIVRAANSFVLPREVAERMAAACPHGRFVEVSDTYHHVMLDNPAALATVIETFMNEVPE